ncbi:hypothetical protein HYU15_02725 [Candidatus Woesearchaeota archaeon]|nr:hypothetical protein [Candidatus Woesearchaeota archaeon]
MEKPTVPTSMGDLEATVIKEVNGRLYAAYISPYEIVVAINGSATGKDGGKKAASENGAAGSAADLVTDLMGIIPGQYYSAIKPTIDSFGQPVAVPAMNVYRVRHTGDVGISASEFQRAWQAGLEDKLRKMLPSKPRINTRILGYALFAGGMTVILYDHFRTAPLFTVTSVLLYFAAQFSEVFGDLKYGSERPVAVETLMGAKLRYIEQ